MCFLLFYFSLLFFFKFCSRRFALSLLNQSFLCYYFNNITDNIWTLQFQLFNDSTYEQILISCNDLVSCNFYIDIFILAKNLYRTFRVSTYYLMWQKMIWIDSITDSVEKIIGANSRRYWSTEEPGVFQFLGSQRVRTSICTIILRANSICILFINIVSVFL